MAGKPFKPAARFNPGQSGSQMQLDIETHLNIMELIFLKYCLSVFYIMLKGIWYNFSSGV
jgi:hypothetical protein